MWVLDGATDIELLNFFAFDAAFTGGVRVGVGDLDGDGQADIVAAAGPGGGPHVTVFDGVSGMALGSFFAYPTDVIGGVYPSVAVR